jgi:hypothetical protein
MCQAVDAINSQVFLQVYRKISLLIIGCLIASETACPIKILTSFRRDLNIRRAEIIQGVPGGKDITSGECSLC